MENGFPPTKKVCSDDQDAAHKGDLHGILRKKDKFLNILNYQDHDYSTKSNHSKQNRRIAETNR